MMPLHKGVKDKPKLKQTTQTLTYYAVQRNGEISRLTIELTLLYAAQVITKT